MSFVAKQVDFMFMQSVERQLDPQSSQGVTMGSYTTNENLNFYSLPTTFSYYRYYDYMRVHHTMKNIQCRPEFGC